MAACHQQPHNKVDVAHYSNVVFSIGIKKTSHCDRHDPTWKPIPSPNDSFWQKTISNGWCEYRYGKLISAWAEANGMKSEKILVLANDQAVLAYPSPDFDEPSSYLGSECARVAFAASIQTDAPTFGPLRLCQQSETATHRMYYTLTKTHAGYLPLVVVEPKSGETKKTIAYLVGGPYGGSIKDLSNFNSLSYIVSTHPDVRVVVPFYLGTTDIFVVTRDNVGLAESQIRDLLKSMKKQADAVCAIGGSLGGYILAGVDVRGVDRLLISPLLETPRRTIARTASLDQFEDHVVTLKTMSLKKWTSGSWTSQEQTPVRRSTAFLNYFGKDADKSLAGRIRNVKSDISLVYGSKDLHIGLSEIANVRAKLGPSALRNVGAVGHLVESRENFWAIEASLNQFLSECDA